MKSSLVCVLERETESSVIVGDEVRAEEAVHK
jgi:hypothetical protein